uniref:Uncharacterized protein n=1 Tax=Rhizophora mucronata TaxID=61149 RepID=A0A2P2MZI1_RHIMU
MYYIFSKDVSSANCPRLIKNKISHSEANKA